MNSSQRRVGRAFAAVRQEMRRRLLEMGQTEGLELVAAVEGLFLQLVGDDAVLEIAVRRAAVEDRLFLADLRERPTDELLNLWREAEALGFPDLLSKASVTTVFARYLLWREEPAMALRVLAPLHTELRTAGRRSRAQWLRRMIELVERMLEEADEGCLPTSEEP